jgi:hypothetical protein
MQLNAFVPRDVSSLGGPDYVLSGSPQATRGSPKHNGVRILSMVTKRILLSHHRTIRCFVDDFRAASCGFATQKLARPFQLTLSG